MIMTMTFLIQIAVMQTGRHWYFNMIIMSLRRDYKKQKLLFFVIGIKNGFSCINIPQVPWEVLKTEAKGPGEC